MSSIEIDAAKVTLTETTLRDLLRACEEARATIPFTDDPMPEGDMATEDYNRERIRRGAVRVKSYISSGVAFEIHLDDTSVGGGETMGYRLVQPFADDLEMGTRMHGPSSHPRASLIVHILKHGKALCGMTGVPREWHESHHWTRYLHVATCQDCLHQASLDVGL